MKTYDAVAWLPIQTHGEGSDAFRSIFHQGDFAGPAIDQFGGGRPYAFVNILPRAVVQTAEVQTVVCQMLHRASRAAVQRGNGRVVQVNQVVTDREFRGVTFP